LRIGPRGPLALPVCDDTDLVRHRPETTRPAVGGPCWVPVGTDHL